MLSDLNPGHRSDRPFGELQPPPVVNRGIQRAQRMPRNWWGKQFAQLVRRRASRLDGQFYDVEVAGLRLRSNFRDNNSERTFVFMPWRFDQSEREYIAQHLPPDGRFVDVGANVGIYSLWAAAHLSATGHVLAFEPNPKAYERLAFNVAANAESNGANWPSMDLVPLGVSDAETNCQLRLHPNNLGGSSLVMNDECGQEINIRCVPLLEELQQRNIDRIDILKIDIEGAEDKALLPFFDHAPPSLYPRAVIMEDSAAVHWRIDPRERLYRLGYRLAVKGRRNAVFALP